MSKGRSIYLDKLEHNQLFLDSPLPLEVAGSENNYVASWLEAGIDGEGKTEDEAVDDCRKEIIKSYMSMRGSIAAHTDKQAQLWSAMIHYIGEVRKGRAYKSAMGEEYREEDDDKGPVYG